MGAWLVHALVTTLLWGVWGALAGLPGEHGVPETLNYVVWALTMIPPALFVLRQGGHCYYADEDAIGPLWKGLRFPLDQCISGWVMTRGIPAAIPDIFVDPRIPQEAYRPTFVKSLLMVPVRPPDAQAAIGLYWASHHEATAD